MSIENMINSLQTSLKNAYLLAVNDDIIKYIIKKAEVICPLGWNGKCLDVTKCIYCEKMLEGEPQMLKNIWYDYNSQKLNTNQQDIIVQNTKPTDSTSIQEPKVAQDVIVQNTKPTDSIPIQEPKVAQDVKSIEKDQIKQDAILFMNTNYPKDKKYTSYDDFVSIREKMRLHYINKFPEFGKYYLYIKNEIWGKEQEMGQILDENQCASHSNIIDDIRKKAKTLFLLPHMNNYTLEFEKNVQVLKKTYFSH
jgi:hypothetical protein